MRKYLIAFIFLSTGLLLVILALLSGNSQIGYAEDVFGKSSGGFETRFNSFYREVEIETKAIKERFSDDSAFRDTLETRRYLLEKMNSLSALSTLGVFRDSYKIVAKRDGASLVYAIDSTDKMDVVRWRRFEKEKQVGSWDESFDREIEQTEWYGKLWNTEDERAWFVNGQNDRQRDAENYLYCGYSFSAVDQKTLIIFQFSKDLLLESLNLNKVVIPLVTLMTKDGRRIELAGNEKSGGNTDSLRLSLERHYQRFADKEKGMFNFSHEEEVYWNSFHRFPPETGLDHYLFTMNSEDLALNGVGIRYKLLVGVGSVLILIGLTLLAIRKRFFYKTNRMEIPGLSELLADDENRFLEFKSSMRWDHRQEKVNPELEKVILKTLAAFGNTDGGILLIGVDDDKKIVGLDKDFQSLKKKDPDYYEIHLRNLLHKQMGVKYVSRYIRTKFETTNGGKAVCKIRVLPGDEPVFLKFRDKNGNIDEKFFVRSGNSSQEIESIMEINDYINKKFKK